MDRTLLTLALSFVAPALSMAQETATPPATPCQPAAEQKQQAIQTAPDAPAPLSEEETRFKWLFLAHFLAASADLTPDELDEADLFAIVGQRAIDRMDPESIPPALRACALELSAVVRQYRVPLFPNKLPAAEYIEAVHKTMPHFKAIGQRYPEATKRLKLISTDILRGELPEQLRETSKQIQKRLFDDKSLNYKQRMKRMHQQQSQLLFDWLSKEK